MNITQKTAVLISTFIALSTSAWAQNPSLRIGLGIGGVTDEKWAEMPDFQFSDGFVLDRSVIAQPICFSIGLQTQWNQKFATRFSGQYFDQNDQPFRIKQLKMDGLYWFSQSRFYVIGGLSTGHLKGTYEVIKRTKREETGLYRDVNQSGQLGLHLGAGFQFKKWFGLEFNAHYVLLDKQRAGLPSSADASFVTFQAVFALGE